MKLFAVELGDFNDVDNSIESESVGGIIAYNELPKAIVPIKVNSISEAKKVINQLDNIYPSFEIIRKEIKMTLLVPLLNIVLLCILFSILYFLIKKILK